MLHFFSNIYKRSYIPSGHFNFHPWGPIRAFMRAVLAWGKWPFTLQSDKSWSKDRKWRARMVSLTYLPKGYKSQA